MIFRNFLERTCFARGTRPPSCARALERALRIRTGTPIFTGFVVTFIYVYNMTLRELKIKLFVISFMIPLKRSL